MLKKIFKFILLLICFGIITSVFAFLAVHYLIKNQPVVVVPDLQGKDINYCVEQLESLSLTPRIKNSQFNNSIPVNHIISQKPDPGEFVKKGRDVHLVLSMGKKSNTMPKLSGLNYEEAQIQIVQNGLKLNHISYTHHDKVPRDHIITSSPQVGVFVKSGEKVDILVSLGKRPKEYLMPDVTGKTIEEATKDLASKNLVIAKIATKYSKDFQEGTILSQSPGYGIKVREDDKITLVLNQKDSPSLISPVIGSRIIHYKLPPGLLRSHIKAEVDMYDRSFIIYDDYLKPDTQIGLLVPFDQNAEIRIYKDNELVISKTLYPFKSIDEKLIKFNYNPLGYQQ